MLFKRTRLINLSSIVAIASIAAPFSVAAMSAMAQAGDMSERNGLYQHGHGMMRGANQWDEFGMVLGPAFMILIAVGIVAGIIYLSRLFCAAGPAVSSHATHDRAPALLKERYAKGQIDSAEFTGRKKLLAD
jgi:putative membrane protein